jgi:hypothetical protein
MIIDFAGDMSAIFLASGFEETILYDGTAIDAIVDRGETMTLGRSGVSGGAGLNKFKVTITISKSDVPSVVEREDMVTVSHHGRVNDTLRVTSIITEDAGSFTLGLV